MVWVFPLIVLHNLCWFGCSLIVVFKQLIWPWFFPISIRHNIHWPWLFQLQSGIIFTGLSFSTHGSLTLGVPLIGILVSFSGFVSPLSTRVSRVGM